MSCSVIPYLPVPVQDASCYGKIGRKCRKYVVLSLDVCVGILKSLGLSLSRVSVEESRRPEEQTAPDTAENIPVYPTRRYPRMKLLDDL